MEEKIELQRESAESERGVIIRKFTLEIETLNKLGGVINISNGELIAYGCPQELYEILESQLRSRKNDFQERIRRFKSGYVSVKWPTLESFFPEVDSSTFKPNQVFLIFVPGFIAKSTAIALELQKYGKPSITFANLQHQLYKILNKRGLSGVKDFDVVKDIFKMGEL